MWIALLFLIALSGAGLLTGMSWCRTGRIPKIWLTVFSLLLCSAAAWLVTSDVADIRRARQTKQWPTVVGTVVQSEIVGSRAIRPLVIYQYSIDSARFVDSSSLGIPSFGNRRIRRDESSKLTAEYAAGDSVIVHYNPQDPQESMLYAREDWASYVRLSLGVFLGICGLILVAWVWRR